MDETPTDLILEDQVGIMRWHGQDNYGEQFRALEAQKSGTTGVANEQIVQTKRGSNSWDRYQVLSWEEERDYMTGVGYVIGASYLTITEAWMYEAYLRKQGKRVAIN